MSPARPDLVVVALVGSVLSAPVLAGSLMEGRMPLETALTRVAVILLLTWCGAALLGTVVRATAEPVEPTPSSQATPPSQARDDEPAETPATDVP